jgi:hypothetical protein
MKRSLRETVKTYRAARTHEAAIAKDGARCSDSPCPICAAISTALIRAIDSNLDELPSCPRWLAFEMDRARGLGEKYLEYLRTETLKASFGGMWFSFEGQNPGHIEYRPSP